MAHQKFRLQRDRTGTTNIEVNIKYFLQRLFLLTLFFQNYIIGGYRNFERIEWMYSVNRGVFPGYSGATLVIGGGEKHVRDTNKGERIIRQCS